jgi:hypothetical protein
LQIADKKALLVHVIAIMRLYIVLDDFLFQNSKVLSIRMLRVGFMPLEVYGAEIFVVKFILMSDTESGSPVLAGLSTT